MALTYTTHLKKLILPEYGRNIQNMVDRCLAIEDRVERTACANTIVKAMLSLFPNAQADQEEYRRKLWDHLYIMSNFKLDVDVPFEPIRPDIFDDKPEPVKRPDSIDRITFRHYGILLQDLIDKAAEMPDGEEKTELVFLISSQMKKLRTAHDSDYVDDERVFNDLHYLSKGRINVPRGAMILPDYKAPVAVGGKKKKKK